MQDTYETLANVLDDNGWQDTLATIANILEEQDPELAARLAAFVAAETKAIEDTF